MISLAEAAKQLGVSVQRVQQMVVERELPVDSFGNRLVLDSNLLARLSRRPTGRPVPGRNAWAWLVILRGDRVPSEPWVLQHGVSPPVVAADLLHDPDPRVVRAAEALF